MADFLIEKTNEFLIEEIDESLLNDIKNNPHAKLYLMLSFIDCPSDQDIAEMEKIFILADDDDKLASIINQIDDLVSVFLGLLDDEFKNYYEDQRAWIQEYMEIIPDIISSWQHRQVSLKWDGLYNGPIDGFCGQETHRAIKMQKSNFS